MNPVNILNVCSNKMILIIIFVWYKLCTYYEILLVLETDDLDVKVNDFSRSQKYIQGRFGGLAKKLKVTASTCQGQRIFKDTKIYPRSLWRACKKKFKVAASTFRGRAKFKNLEYYTKSNSVIYLKDVGNLAGFLD